MSELDPTLRRGVPEEYPARAVVEPEDERSLGQIMSDLSRNVSTLMRQEVELAKAEVQQSAKTAGKGAGMLGGAGVAGLLAALFVSLALWWLLAQLLAGTGSAAYGWAFVIVAVLWGIAAAVLMASGRAALRDVQGLPKTAETVGKIPNALTGDEEKNQ
ncbi:MAG: phage holin family protein [Micropruina sp.]|nr:MAG: phage holin family protein [Micropruina sp.]